MNDRDAVQLLEDVVRATSPSGEERPAVELYVRRLARLGLRAGIDEAGNAVAEIGDAGPELCLLGHIDTVPGVVPVRREGGRLYGRGSVDAKGPLVAFAVAAARAHAAGSLAHRVQIVGCVEEEAPSSKGARFRAGRPAPDACIVGEPSGWDAMTLGYKGYLRARIAVAQPCAHGAHDGRSAPARACALWVEIERAAWAFNEGRERLYEQLLPNLVGLRTSSDGLEERADLDVQLRLPEDLPPPEAERWLTELAPDAAVVTEGGLPAWTGPRAGALPRALARQIARRGGRARYLRKTGTADLNVVAPAWGCPCLAYGPGDSSLDHTPDEHIEIDEFLRGAAVLESVLSDATAVVARGTEAGAERLARSAP